MDGLLVIPSIEIRQTERLTCLWLLSRTAVDILDGLLNTLDAVFRVGVGAKELRRPVTRLRGCQDFHHTYQFIRIIAGVINEAHAKIIRL